MMSDAYPKKGAGRASLHWRGGFNTASLPASLGGVKGVWLGNRVGAVFVSPAGAYSALLLILFKK